MSCQPSELISAIHDNLPHLANLGGVPVEGIRDVLRGVLVNKFTITIYMTMHMIADLCLTSQLQPWISIRINGNFIWLYSN